MEEEKEKPPIEYVTKDDLELFYVRITAAFQVIIDEYQSVKFYSAKEFSELTGMAYTTVVNRLHKGTIRGSQSGKRSGWLIPHSEVVRLKIEADKNLLASMG